jgi:hypothetical protein
MLTNLFFRSVAKEHCAYFRLRYQYHFPRKKKAAVPVKARKYSLALSGLQKNGSRWPVPACAFAPHASGTPFSNREESRLYRTIFIRWGVESLYMTLLVKAACTALYSGRLSHLDIFR